MNVSEAMVQYLKAAGVGHVFGYQGDPNVEFMEAARRAGMQFVLGRREGTAGLMAEACGFLTVRPGVCMSRFRLRRDRSFREPSQRQSGRAAPALSCILACEGPGDCLWRKTAVLIELDLWRQAKRRPDRAAFARHEVLDEPHLFERSLFR